MPNIKAILVGITFIVATSVHAQNAKESLFGRYGLGDLEFLGSTSDMMVGGTGIAMGQTNEANLLNPSFTVFQDAPVFNVNGGSIRKNIVGSGFEQNQSFSGMRSFSMAFPVARKFGFQFGLRPFTNASYNITTTQTRAIADSIDVNATYRGNGGLRNAFLGVVYDIYNTDDSLDLVLGAQFEHFFGPTEQLRILYTPALDETGYGIRNELTANLQGSTVALHGLFRFYPNPNKSLRVSVGGFYKPAVKLSGDQEIFSYTFQRSLTGVDAGEDTIQFSNTSENTATLPARIGLGASITFWDGFQLGIDYQRQDWSQFSQEVSLDVFDGNFSNYQRVSLGLQYTPNKNILFNEPIWKFMTYSAGAWSTNDFITYNGSELKEIGTSFGISIPFRKSRSYSSVQMGMTYSVRGDLSQNLIQEQNTQFIFGVSLCPNFIDRWFYKRKYD